MKMIKDPCDEHGMGMCEMCHGGQMAQGGDVKGVHRPMKAAPGESFAGAETRAMRKAERSGEEEEYGDAKSYAKDAHHRVLGELKSMSGHNRHNLAEGGFVEEEEASGYGPELEDEHDLISRVMMSKAKGYSKGGRVANDTPVTADFEKNEFDDLVKDDHLEMHETGANSGDELGDEQEDDDRKDIISRTMKSRRMKDRMPRPA